jgi:hypothetical protein
MNQPMSFVWNTEAASLAKKAGATGGISETGAYEDSLPQPFIPSGKMAASHRRLS